MMWVAAAGPAPVGKACPSGAAACTTILLLVTLVAGSLQVLGEDHPGTLAAVRSKPDGYTLLIASIGLAANPSLYKKLAFEPQSDLEPITLIANSPTVLAVPPSLPVRSLVLRSDADQREISGSRLR